MNRQNATIGLKAYGLLKLSSHYTSIVIVPNIALIQKGIVIVSAYKRSQDLIKQLGK